jgi:hypothetical protein
VIFPILGNAIIWNDIEYYCPAASPLAKAVDLFNQFQINSTISEKPVIKVKRMTEIVEACRYNWIKRIGMKREIERHWNRLYLEQEAKKGRLRYSSLVVDYSLNENTTTVYIKELD